MLCFCLYCVAWSCRCSCIVMQMLYVCVMCASCGSSQCCILHDLQFVNAGSRMQEATIWNRHIPEPVL